MNRITFGKLFELYCDIFETFGIYLLHETDEMIDYYVFEATDINIGYCSGRILNLFLDEGIINEEISADSSLLLKKFRSIENTDLWNAESVKNSLEWLELMEQSEKIKKMIKAKWTDEELEEIYRFNQAVSF
ncbi:hypothetical protein LJC58_09575 [Lachnospiraceae bacterium OttesenSCG-928-D06]|nr:hypothetical protein [Lachnospiraceae bacterium OttesenSCG-928-D06]